MLRPARQRSDIIVVRANDRMEEGVAPLGLGHLVDAPCRRRAEPAFLVHEAVPRMRPQALAGVAQQHDQLRIWNLVSNGRDDRGGQDEIGRTGLAPPERPKGILELRVIGGKRVLAPEMRKVTALLFWQEKSTVGRQDFV